MNILIIVLKYVTSFGINFLQVPVSYLHVLISAFDVRGFSKCLMTFGCSFIFKNEVPNGDRMLCVHGRSCRLLGIMGGDRQGDLAI